MHNLGCNNNFFLSKLRSYTQQEDYCLIFCGTTLYRPTSSEVPPLLEDNTKINPKATNYL